MLVTLLMLAGLVTIAQAQSQLDVTASVECQGDDGIVRATIENFTGATQTITMDLQPTTVGPRTVNLPDGGSHVESWSGRGDGEHLVSASYVDPGGNTVVSQAITDVTCDGTDSWFNTGICLVASIWCDIAGIDPASLLSDLAAGTAELVIGAISEGLAALGVDMLLTAVSWWSSVSPMIINDGGTVQAVSGHMLWISALVALAGVIWQSIRLTLGQEDAAKNIAQGVITVSVAGGAGWAATQAIAIGAHQWSVTFLNSTINDPLLRDRLEIAFTVISPFAAMALAIIAFFVGLFHLVFNIFREFIVILLGGLIPFAASMGFFGFGREWLPRLLSKMLAIVMAKPFAAASLAIGLQMLANATTFLQAVAGMVFLIGSVFTPFILIKLFSFTNLGGAGAGAAAGLGAMAAGGLLRGSGGGAGGSFSTAGASTSAAGGAQRLPPAPSGGASSGGSGGFAVRMQGPPAGSASSGASAGGSASSGAAAGGSASSGAAAGGVAAAAPVVAAGAVALQAGRNLAGSVDSAAGAGDTAT